MKKFSNIFVKSLCLLLSVNLSSCTMSQMENNISSDGVRKFPAGFLWGTATAAYQVEGGITNDWSTNGLDAGKAAEHYQKYDKDFKTAKSLSNNAHRFSIEWARIEPEEGKWDYQEVEHYRDVLKSLKANGLKPMVTLQHFTNPVWIARMGGWENEKIIPFFNRYVKFIVNELQNDVDIWITINEPNVYAFKAYDDGEWPPYKKDRQAALQVMKNELIAHKEAYKSIHQTDKVDADGDGPSASVGFAQHISLLQPYFPLNPLDNIQAYFQGKVFNEGILDAIATGVIDLSIPGMEPVKNPFDADLKGSVDFLGVNYYTRYLVKAFGDRVTSENAELNDLGWEIYPQGMLTTLRLMNRYASQLKVPIYITENGLDDRRDRKRAKFLVTHLNKVWEAVNEGIPVKGYIHWTLMDNYEWSDKYGPRFGLMTIDRQLRNSAKVYQNIAANNGLSQELLDEYNKIKN